MHDMKETLEEVAVELEKIAKRIRDGEVAAVIVEYVDINGVPSGGCMSVDRAARTTLIGAMFGGLVETVMSRHYHEPGE